MTRHLAMVPDMPPSSTRPASGFQIRADRRLRFGDFELIASSCELFRRNGDSRLRPVKLQPQPAKVLLYLAERSGSLVSRVELQQHLWGEGRFVDHEQGLNYCIRAVRRALEDDASDPEFLETVPRRGYRFLGRVEERQSRAGTGMRPGGSALRPVRVSDRSRGRLRPSRTAVVLAMIAVLSLALHWALSAGLLLSPSPPKIAVLPFDNHTGTDDDPLAASLTDGLIAHLASDHSGELGVIALASSFAYAGQNLTAAQIGSELDADYLLTGRLQASDPMTRISVQLVRVRDETNVWAEVYERPRNQADWDGWTRLVCREVADRLAPPKS